MDEINQRQTQGARHEEFQRGLFIIGSYASKVIVDFNSFCNFDQTVNIKEEGPNSTS